MNPDVKLSYDAIMAKSPGFTEAFQYYDGDQPLVYANDRLKNVFKGVQIKFIENWCSTVIDSVKERIQLESVIVPDNAVQMMDSIWEANIMNLETDDLHEGLLVTGEAFMIVWKEDTELIPSMYYNDPRMCHAFYYSDRPRVMRCAAKLWEDENKHYRMTLYYPDHFEYYISTSTTEHTFNPSNFIADDSVYAEGIAPNETGRIPVFHYQLNKRKVIGDLYNVIPIQNGINKLLTDMMVAAEFGAFRQRWIISNADPGTLKNSPNEIWSLAAGDGMGQQTQVGEFNPTDLGNYLDAINQLAGDIARITRTPKHYFYNQGGDPSGEALIAMEAPLNRKVADHIQRVDPVWEDAFQYALFLAGVSVELQDISLVWQKVETVQPMTEAQIRLLEIQAGIPILNSLRRAGWSDTELDQLKEDRDLSGADIGDAILSGFEKGQ